MTEIREELRWSMAEEIDVRVECLRELI